MPEYIQQQRQAAIDLARHKVDAEKDEKEKDTTGAKHKKEIPQNQPEKRVLLFWSGEYVPYNYVKSRPRNIFVESKFYLTT